MTSVKQFKQENQRSNLYNKRETLMNHTNKRQPLNNRLLAVCLNQSEFLQRTMNASLRRDTCIYFDNFFFMKQRMTNSFNLSICLESRILVQIQSKLINISHVYFSIYLTPISYMSFVKDTNRDWYIAIRLLVFCMAIFPMWSELDYG